MGSNPGQKRRWIAKLRKHFFSLDKFSNGTMAGPKLLRVLRELEVKLTKREESTLLDLLGTSSEDDLEDGELGGNISYRELLRFCALAAGKWFEQSPDLAAMLRGALRDNMRKGQWVADLRDMFEQMDDDADGMIGKRDFEKSCRKMGLKLDKAGLGKLMDLLDIDGSGGVSYLDFVSFFNVHSAAGSGNGGEWFDAEPEIARKLAQAVKSAGGKSSSSPRRRGKGGGEGGGKDVSNKKGDTACARFRDECTSCDSEGEGLISAKDLRKCLSRGLRVKLGENDMSRLEMVLDEGGDGLLMYRPVVQFLLSAAGTIGERRHAEMAVVAKAVGKAKGGRRATIATLAERMQVADKDGSGSLSVKHVLHVLAKSGVKAAAGGGLATPSRRLPTRSTLLGMATCRSTGSSRA